MQEIMNNSKYNVHAIPSFEEGKLILLARGHGYDTWMQQKKQNVVSLGQKMATMRIPISTFSLGI